MKKALLALLILLLIPFVSIACGNADEDAKPTGEEVSASEEDTASSPDETLPVETAAETEEETDAPEETGKEAFTFDPNDYKFVQKVPAPEGDRREIVMDYMLKMAKIEWTPAENFTITWKDKGSFSVKLDYKAGTVYKDFAFLVRERIIEREQRVNIGLE